MPKQSKADDIPAKVKELVDSSDMKGNQKLLTDKEITDLKKQISNMHLPPESDFLYIPKRKLNTLVHNAKYSIICTGDGALHAVYRGEKHGKLVGKGASGTARLAQNLNTGEWEILKVQARATKEGKRVQQDNEVAISKEAGIVKSSGVTINKKNNERLKMLMILLPGKTLDTVDSFSPNERMSIMLKLLANVHELHNKNISHGDIQLPNIMYDKTKGMLQVFDFGTSQKYKDSESSNFIEDKKRDCNCIGGVLMDLFKLSPVDATKGKPASFIASDTSIFPDKKTKNMVIAVVTNLLMDQPSSLENSLQVLKDALMQKSIQDRRDQYAGRLGSDGLKGVTELKRPEQHEGVKENVAPTKPVRRR